MAVRVIEVHESVFAEKDRIARETRHLLKAQGTFMVNLMASPGAGKTTTLLRTFNVLREEYSCGVMEADIDATVDADRMQAAGVRTIEVHTGGACAMDAVMTRDALQAFDTKDLDLLVLENVGNLVCPAEEDVGASCRVNILSVPEGDDKPLKYPLMFEVCDAVLINKIDAEAYFDFDRERAAANIRLRNPDAEIFFVSAKTGEGFDAWTDYLRGKIREWKSSAQVTGNEIT
ncbi:MAG TPA: hydrogenase accessory protein HypB [Lachnospiraceae bacterium]|nr:hydrogenase accessory protein HypB [Lachnospiraceae bacterium]HAP73109.1 hydrogenase accessory protein HypB [Lachnospiraceae bacterium]HBH70593.1 hydrogenase accessory protein HypB [Lachnospiraceae bacterium]